jgi:hypothetical protein
MLRQLIFLFCLSLLTSSAVSQDKKQPDKKDMPRIKYSIPLVVKTGEKQKLTLRGKGLAAVKEVRVEGIEKSTVKVLGGKAVGVSNTYPVDRVGDSEVELELDLPKDSKPGELKLVALGAGGESTPYTLLLRDGIPAVVEKEPNDGFEQAQAVQVPSAIEGTIKTEKDVDVYKFVGKKGDKLRIEVQAARYGSPLDAMLTFYDADRRVIDSASDSSGLPDPILNATLTKDGEYYVSVIDTNDLGGSNYGYRLVVTREK